ncbi:MAG: hypothetical protein HYV09_38715 [Deltaproteobacteria bacterium]|nr:hypothetical protein [Deltaproteobacteria bacterium]
MRRILFVLAFVSIGCGGSVGESSPSNGHDAAADGTTDAALGDGGCLLPTEGAACKSTDVVCPPVGDVCCIGYVWSCESSSGTWRKLGLGCPCVPEDTGAEDGVVADTGQFTCGSSACSAGQICTKRPPGIPTDGPPPLYYSCYPMPTACLSTPTCECVKANIGGMCTVTDCTVEDGHVVLGCMGA